MLALRAKAGVLARENVLPIIEPVNQNPTRLLGYAQALQDAGDSFIVIVNPKVGDFAGNPTQLHQAIIGHEPEFNSLIVGILLDRGTTIAEVQAIVQSFQGYEIAFIHDDLDTNLPFGQFFTPTTKHFFIHGSHPYAYAQTIQGGLKSTIVDSFAIRNNADYPDDEFFSDVHLTHRQLGFDSFGDFTIMPAEFREGGGQPYCVAIHILHLDNGPTSPMRMFHFKSTDRTTRGRAPEKAVQALNVMVNQLQQTPIFEDIGIAGLRTHQANSHNPGLGKLKELGITHHIETFMQVS